MSTPSSPPSRAVKHVAFNDDKGPVLPRIEPDDNNESWEDVPSPTTESFSLPPTTISNNSSNTTSTSGSPAPRMTRKRRAFGKANTTTRARQQTPIVDATSDGNASTPGLIRRSQLPLPSVEELLHGIVTSGGFALRYFLDIMLSVVVVLKRPLVGLFALWAFAWILSRASGILYTSVVQPICHVPLVSRMEFCDPVYSRTPASSKKTKGSPKKGKAKWADYPTLVSVQGPTFEKLLESSMSGSLLSMDIKKAEMATADLATLVRTSDLHSKETLARMLVEFVDDARRAGRGMQKLNSKMGGAVDSIMAVNDYALNAITSAAANKPSVISSVFNSIIPWGTPLEDPETVVLNTFINSMDVLSGSLSTLILQFQAAVKSLDDLEARLATIHEAVARENSNIDLQKSEVLSALWTTLGGNRSKIKRFDNHIDILKGITEYRKQALAQVVGALQTLIGMSEDVEDLRERVAAPDVVGVGPGGKKGIPMEVHVKSIKSGLERLKEGRMRARLREEEAMRRVLGTDDDDDDEFGGSGVRTKRAEIDR